MKKLLLALPIAVLLCTPVYAQTIDDVLDDYDIESAEELDDALFVHQYFREELGYSFGEIEEALYYRDIMKDYGIEDDEDLERALYAYDVISCEDIYDEDGNYIDIIPSWEKEEKTTQKPTVVVSDPTPTPTPTESFIDKELDNLMNDPTNSWTFVVLIGVVICVIVFGSIVWFERKGR